MSSDFSHQVEHEIEVVMRIDRVGKSIEERYAKRYYRSRSLCSCALATSSIPALPRAKGPSPLATLWRAPFAAGRYCIAASNRGEERQRLLHVAVIGRIEVLLL